MSDQLDQIIWDQIFEMETGAYAMTPAFVDADGWRDFYGAPNAFVPAIRNAVIEALALRAETITVHWDGSVSDFEDAAGDGANSVADWLRTFLPKEPPP